LIPKECKRLAEVDFPVAEVSKHSAREKSIRHGHPSILHLWWARRPLAACRAMLMALLLPDPCDSHCPEEFKKSARRLLPPVQGKVGPADSDLRKALLKFIADFANWDNSANAAYLECARGLVRAAHGEEAPLVVDPFAGGGSIPLEALRLGCEAFASDLNPVACLILKVLLEDIPRHGPGLAVELRRVGKEIKEAAEKELADFYPSDPDGSRPIAYLWARKVKCEAPNCGAEIPLMRSFWLCKKASRKRALRYTVDRSDGKIPRVEFEVFTPKRESEVPGGTVTRAKAMCMCCGTVLPPERVRAQLIKQRGGADVIFDKKGNRTSGARMLAVVTLQPRAPGRHYRLPSERDYGAVWKAQKRVAAILDEWERGGKEGLCPVPNEPVDQWHHDVNRLPMYGMKAWGEAFTARQTVALLTLSKLLRPSLESSNGHTAGLVMGRLADFCVSLARWKVDAECPVQAMARQVLPMVWDFAEVNPWTDSTGSVVSQTDRMAEAIESVCIPFSSPGRSQVADAAESPLPDQTVSVWFSDPPYYDAIDYAHCSDFFFVWLKRALPGHPILRDPFDSHNPLTPKTREIVVDSTTTKGHGLRTPEFYEQSMARAFAEGRRVLTENGIGSVVFAHKTTEGWEALLSGLIRGGWSITGSWPIATEMGSRLRARESAALATSVHLVCRPRPEDARIGDWADVLRELPQRVGEWMERLQSEGIRGADLVFSCIGPALELFSRYHRVETAEGREVKLPEYLEKVWEVVGRTALQQVLGTAEAKARNSAAGALEEDARLTALFLWTLQSTNIGDGTKGGADKATGEADEGDDDEEASSKTKKGYVLVYDVVRRFAQPLGIHLENWEGRVIESKKGTVRLIPVIERSDQLFGQAGTQAVAQALERIGGRDPQYMLFPEEERRPGTSARSKRARRGKKGADAPAVRREATTLDRVHAAMLLQPCGRTRRSATARLPRRPVILTRHREPFHSPGL